VVVAGRRDDRYLIDDEAVRPHELATGDFRTAWSAHRKARHQRLVAGLPADTVDLDEAAAVLGEPRLTRAAALFREAGREWSAVADRAVRAAGPVGDLREQQLFGQLTGAGPEELREIADRIAAVGVADPRAGDPALLAGLADGVQAACAAETAAVELMRL
jgi:hypothetical protein